MPVQRQSQDQVEQEGGDYHAAEHRAVQEHHRQCRDPHQPIDDRGDEAFGDDIPDRFERNETRQDVADVAFFEISERQSDQMVKQAAPHREMQRVLKIEARQ